jgi:hypothetical protein
MVDNLKLAASLSVIAALVIGILRPAPAHAAWEVVPDLTVSAHNDKNPRFDQDGPAEPSTTSAIFDAAADIANFTDRGFLTFEPRLRAYRYADSADSDLESEDVFMEGSGERRWQTVTAGFNAHFQRERLLSAEFAEVDPDNDPDTQDPEDVDTGRLLFINEDRERVRLSPYLAFQVSERNALRLQVTDTEVTYPGGNLAGRTGYQATQVSAGIYRTVDARNSLSAVVTVDNFEADINQNVTDTVTVEGSFTRPVSEVWSFNLAAGVLRSDFEFLTTNLQRVDRAVTDYTLRVGFRRRAERSRINVDLGRSVFPSSTGFSAVRRELRVFMDQALTQRLSANFGFRVNETGTLGDISERDNRDYVRAEIGFEWALKPVLFLGGGYHYTSQDFTFLGGNDAKSQSLYIGLNYRGLSRR